MGTKLKYAETSYKLTGSPGVVKGNARSNRITSVHCLEVVECIVGGKL